jgi:predicted TPR repeat methyltransferase
MDDGAFEQAKDLFIRGTQSFGRGEFAQAEKYFEGSLALLPGRASTLSNLGAARLKLGKPEQAVEALEEAAAAQPEAADTHAHLAAAFNELGRHKEALAAADKALALDGKLGAAWLHRADSLQAMGRLEEAVKACDGALALDAGLAHVWTNRGGLLKELGRLPEAADAFRKAIDAGGDPELNGYFVASLTGEAAPASPPQGYVQGLFDNYAPGFEKHLVEVLRYQAHTVLLGNLARIAPERFSRALDLGCGTGLCGPLIRQRALHVDGVDLSRGMVQAATATGAYDEVTQGDVAAFLAQTPHRYDLVASADVFIYVGALEAVFSGVQRVMPAGGIFCFSVERAGDGRDFELRTSQRYAHSRAYIQKLAEGHGFEVAGFVEAPVREDQRQPVAGLYAYLRRR